MQKPEAVALQPIVIRAIFKTSANQPILRNF